MAIGSALFNAGRLVLSGPVRAVITAFESKCNGVLNLYRYQGRVIQVHQVNHGTTAAESIMNDGVIRGSEGQYGTNAYARTHSLERLADVPERPNKPTIYLVTEQRPIQDHDGFLTGLQYEGELKIKEALLVKTDGTMTHKAFE